jgi:hypothetical protein
MRNPGFTFHLHVPTSLFLSLSLSHRCTFPPTLRSRALVFSLVKVMEEERAPVLYIVGDEPDVPRPEISATSSSSRVSSGG